MQKPPSTESGFSRLRVLSAVVLCTIGAGFALISFAANPSSGTISPSGPTLTWQGTGTGVPPAAGGPGDCDDTEKNCDFYILTIAGTPADWVGKQVKVRITNTLPTTDYDLVIYKDSLQGAQVGSDGRPPSTFEEVVLDPTSPAVGTGVFAVRIVYFAAPPVDQYKGEVSVLESEIVAPPPATPATGVAPRFQVHNPPAAGPNTEGIDAAEPSIGVNWRTEKGTNGGTSMYIALLETLRVTFDDSCPSSPTSLWEDVSYVTTRAQTFDPILYTDHGYPGGTGTGRTLISQLIFPAGSAASASAVTDDDGRNYTPSTGAGPGSGIDHQTIGGGGPYAAPVPTGATYPNPIYYCGQLPAATCALSVDGGQTYGPAIPVDTGGECGGLFGHIKVGPDGTAYLPNKGCGSGQGVIVSENNGVTWDVRAVPGSATGESDAAVGIGRGDKIKQALTNKSVGRVYLGYAHADSKATIAMSDDRGVTWSTPVDVGAAFGINGTAFPVVVAGDDDRAAFAFYGTSTAGSVQGPKFSGVWRLYVAMTYDGGATWHTVDATPNDPMQRGCIWLGGGANICRNMLDFMGIDLDKRGRVLVGYNDGCAGAECSQAGPNAIGNSYTALSAIARQAGGKTLYAEHDALFPDAPTVPGDPYTTALRNGNKVSLQWSLSNDGGSPVTQYNISRGTASGAQTLLATVPGSQLRFEDSTATDAGVPYFYKVTATNAQGTSCGNQEVQARYLGDSATGTGYTIYTDPSGSAEGAGQAANPDLDIQTLSVAEPASGPEAGKLVFNLKVASLATSGNNRMIRIIWDSPNAFAKGKDADGKDILVHHGKFYVGFTKNASGTVSYEYGTVFTEVVGLAVGRPQTRKMGEADAGRTTPEGLISIVVSPEKVGSPGKGDLLGNFEIRTYNVVTNDIRSNNAIDNALNATANDLTANAATYSVVGSPGAAQLLQISTRARTQPGENALIGGFIVTGTAPKRVLIRGIGPSVNIGGRLEDPVVELNGPAGVIATNDNWRDTQQAEIEATTAAPSNDAEAAMIQTLPAGAYTVILSGKNGASGVGLVEVYDLDRPADSKLANLSSRGAVETGDNVMIGGIIVGPRLSSDARVLLRAIGPSLAPTGVNGSLQDPTLELYNVNGDLLTANDNWKDSQEADIAATQIPPSDDREAAILITTAPGNYTAIVRGKNDSTGVALVEAYNVQ